MKTDTSVKTHESEVRHDVSFLTEDDVHLFNEGTHYELHTKLGAHLHTPAGGDAGTYFAVWAPNAGAVSVVGDFNDWHRTRHPLRARGSSGIWEGFIPHLDQGTLYKFHIQNRDGAYQVNKADPFGVFHEVAPKTASIVWDPEHSWQDGEWMKHRGGRNHLSAPMSVYEVHLGAWRRVLAEGNRSLSYRELAIELRIYPRRVPARYGTPVLRIVGISNDGLLRAEQPVRDTARL